MKKKAKYPDERKWKTEKKGMWRRKSNVQKNKMNEEKIKEWRIWRKKQNFGKKENKEKLESRDKTQKYLKVKVKKKMKESINAKKKERKQNEWIMERKRRFPQNPVQTKWIHIFPFMNFFFLEITIVFLLHLPSTPILRLSPASNKSL